MAGFGQDAMNASKRACRLFIDSVGRWRRQAGGRRMPPHCRQWRRCDRLFCEQLTAAQYSHAD
jgi:hypothetical protein